MKTKNIIASLIAISLLPLLSGCQSHGESSSFEDSASSISKSSTDFSSSVDSYVSSEDASSLESSSYEDAPDSFTAEEILPRCHFYSLDNGNCKLSIDTYDSKTHTYDGYANIGELTLPSFSPDGERVVSFSYCHSFKRMHTLHLPLTLLEIDDGALKNYPRLRSVNISSNVRRIRSEAFQNDFSLPSISLPGVKIIEESAFQGCTGLESVDLGSSLMKIQESAFEDCSKVKEITFPSTLEDIGVTAFRGCLNLTSLVIPGNVKNVRRSSFEYCTSLSSLVIEDGVGSIASSAFSYTALKKVFLPKSVTSLGSDAFYNRQSKITVYCESKEKPDGFQDNTFSKDNVKFVYGVSREEFDNL